jgi:tRNA (adenine57-N1/adenine58-N1)-methyltransferase
MLDSSLWKKFKRGPQIIMLKDAAFISAFTGLQSGDRVLECGSGSGFLTVYLASIVAPSGRIYSYERRKEFLEIAQKNVEKAGLLEAVEFSEKDIMQGIAEKELDLVVLDFADSHLALPLAFEALRKGGYCVGYLPNVEQVKEFVLAGEEKGFRHLRTTETIVRELLVRPQGCRPETKGLLHTGYLSFLKKQ